MVMPKTGQGTSPFFRWYYQKVPETCSCAFLVVRTPSIVRERHVCRTYSTSVHVLYHVLRVACVQYVVVKPRICSLRPEIFGTFHVITLATPYLVIIDCRIPFGRLIY